MLRESKCLQDYESNEVAEESVALIMQEESMAFSKQIKNRRTRWQNRL